MNGDPRYFVHDLTDTNIDDLQREVDSLRQSKGRLIAVGDEEQGIIAYALTPGPNAAAKGYEGEEIDGYGKTIVSALMLTEQAVPIAALLRNFDNWLEENGQYEDDDGAARCKAERADIEQALDVLERV